jgi:enamine deaminase RidA (YjgF/YER057c/UK114 family)
MDDASIKDRISSLGLELPPVAAPVASYVPTVRAGDSVYVSGQVALADGTPVHAGHVGRDVSLEQAQDVARRCALQCLAAVRAELGSFDRLARIVKLTVYVASAAGFHDQPKVANGASDLLIELLGDPGRHAREAIGVAELPLGAPVEISLVAQAT